MSEVGVGPFDNLEPGDIPLPAAPLVKVLAQVRFPQFSQFLGDDEQIARKFAASLATDYPLFEEGRESVLMLTPDGVAPSVGGSKLWKLRSADSTWEVSFAHNFLTVDTSAYTRRSEFAARFEQAWEKFRALAPPPFVERVGIRYVNRIEKPELLAQLGTLLRSEIRGVASVNSSTEVETVRALSEALYRFNEGQEFLARWGTLPAGSSFDPSVPPAPVPSWLLDLDSSQNWAPGESKGDSIGDVSSHLALRAYQFFRWAVTPDFLGAFGGEVR